MKWATLTPTQDICGRTRIINQNSEISFTNLFFRDKPGANFYVREAGAGGLPAEEEGLPIQGDQYRGAGLPLHQVGGRDPWCRDQELQGGAGTEESVPSGLLGVRA